MDWCFGKQSAPALKKVMLRHVLEDKSMGNTTHPMITRLAGAGGKQLGSQNTHRSLMSYLQSMGYAGMVSPAEGRHMRFVIRPHVLIQYYSSRYPKQIQTSFGVDPELLFKFWDGLWSRSGSEFLWQEHQHLRHKTPRELSCCIPASWFEDAGPYTKSASVQVVSLSSLMGIGSEIDCKLIMGVHLKTSGEQGLVPTDDGAYKVLFESMDALASGVGPAGPLPIDEKLQGKPLILIDGVSFGMICLFGKADGEQRVVGWRMPSLASLTPCTWCPCNRSDRPWTDLGPLAKWRGYCFTVEEFLRRASSPHHPLLHAAFSSRYFIRVDLMHNIDCKGVLAITGGSVVDTLLSKPELGRNRQQRLNFINQRKSDFYTDAKVPHRFGPITFANLSAKDGEKGTQYSTLSGPTIKAANTRALAPFWESLCEEFFREDSVHDIAICGVARSLNDIIKLLYGADLFLQPAEARQLNRLLLEFGEHFTTLAKLSVQAGQLRWHLSPKVHEMQHIGTQSNFVNARYLQNYAEEGLVGKACEMYAAAANGPGRDSVQQLTVLTKYIAGLSFRCMGAF